jgi:hypothetical protein
MPPTCAPAGGDDLSNLSSKSSKFPARKQTSCEARSGPAAKRGPSSSGQSAGVPETLGFGQPRTGRDTLEGGPRGKMN